MAYTSSERRTIAREIALNGGDLTRALRSLNRKYRTFRSLSDGTLKRFASDPEFQSIVEEMIGNLSTIERSRVSEMQAEQTKRVEEIVEEQKKVSLPKRPHRRAFVSPWRESWVLGAKPKTCFLCEAAQLPEAEQAAWKEALLLCRNEHALAIMNRYPYTGGHVLVAPLRHTADLPALSNEESAALWELSRKTLDVVAKICKAEGYNMGMNLGRAAGAGVEAHLHMHVLPRWNGDTNFMHIVADTSTVPVSLEGLWEKMKPLY
jgi:ATP adenylyltransferase